MRYLVYDIESTGLDTTKSEILELCIIDYKSEKVLLHEYVYPDYETITNSNIHGIDEEKIKSNNGITQDELINKVLELFENKNEKYLMIAHNNNGYDQLLLEYSFKRKNKKLSENVYFSDSVIVLRKMFPGARSYRLGEIYNTMFGENSVNFHSGIDDTKALVKIIKKVYCKEFKKEIESIMRPSFINKEIKKLNYQIIYGLEYSNHKVIKTIYDLHDIYLLLDKRGFIDLLRNDFKIYSKYKINKIIEQLELIME